MGAAVSLGLGGIGLLTGLAGASNSAKAVDQQAMANATNDYFQAAVAANNAKIDQYNAEQQIQTGQSQIGAQGLKNRATIGTTLAAQGASGVNVNKGSSVDVRAGEASLGMLDTQTLASNAARKAYGFNVKSYNDTMQAQLDTLAGQQGMAAVPTATEGSLLSSASSLAGSASKLAQSNAGSDALTGVGNAATGLFNGISGFLSG